MPAIDPAYLAHELKRWMRPDAHRFIRPDWRRFVRPGFEAEHPFAFYERKYSPDQPRVPAGGPDGGQWTSGGDTNSADVESILEMARQLAMGGSSNKYQRCLDICFPILERFQPPGVDFNQWDFHKCMAACMGN